MLTIRKYETLRTLMGVTDTQSYSLVIRDVFFDAVAGDPFFANYTKRKTPMLRVQPELLPYLGVYFADENMEPDGDFNAGAIRFTHTHADRVLGDDREQRPGGERAHARCRVLADHEPAVARPVHHEPDRHVQSAHRRGQSRQRHHRRHHPRPAPVRVRRRPRSPTKRRSASCNTTSGCSAAASGRRSSPTTSSTSTSRPASSPATRQAEMDQRLQVKREYLFDISKRRPTKREKAT